MDRDEGWIRLNDYDIHLPSLTAEERTSLRKKSRRLSASARNQYFARLAAKSVKREPGALDIPAPLVGAPNTRVVQAAVGIRPEPTPSTRVVKEATPAVKDKGTVVAVYRHIYIDTIGKNKTTAKNSTRSVYPRLAQCQKAGYKGYVRRSRGKNNYRGFCFSGVTKRKGRPKACYTKKVFYQLDNKPGVMYVKVGGKKRSCGKPKKAKVFRTY